MVNTTPRLRGIITPLVTPLGHDGSLDLDSLRRLVRLQLAAGVSGLFPLGTSGEVTFLTAAQRQLVISTVVDEAAGVVPVWAGIVESSAARAIEAGRIAVDAGADCLVATGPYYGDVAEVEVANHFERIATALRQPIIAYDIPVKTHQKLSVDTILDLAARRIIVGLKDSSGDFWSFRTLTSSLRHTEFALFTGSDPMVDASLLMGASGAVVGVANIAPAEFVDLYRLALQGDWEAARRTQERLARLATIQSFGLKQGTGGDASFTGALKEALVAMGIIETSNLASGNSYPHELHGPVREVLAREGIAIKESWRA